MGNRILLNDSTGRTTATFDVLNRPVGVQTSVGRMTMGYDPTSNRTLLIDPSGGRTSATFDNAGQPRSLLNPWLERTTWTFDPSGRVIGQALGNSTWSTLTYDSANQWKQVGEFGDGACRSIRALRIAMIRRVCGRRSLRPMATGSARATDAANQLVQEIRTAGNYASSLPFQMPRQLGWTPSTGTTYAVTRRPPGTRPAIAFSRSMAELARPRPTTPPINCDISKTVQEEQLLPLTARGTWFSKTRQREAGPLRFGMGRIVCFKPCCRARHATRMPTMATEGGCCVKIVRARRRCSGMGRMSCRKWQLAVDCWCNTPMARRVTDRCCRSVDRERAYFIFSTGWVRRTD